MSILTLFCRIDDFYLAFEAFLTSRSLQGDKPKSAKSAPIYVPGAIIRDSDNKIFTHP